MGGSRQLRMGFLPGYGRLTAFEAQQTAPLVLAYLGDAVFELYVRDRLLTGVARPAAELHRQTVMRVRATAQATALRTSLGQLTDDETDVARRARNTRCPSYRNIEPADYHYSTAFEAVLGYLYLTGREDRLLALMSQAFEVSNTEGTNGGHRPEDE